MYKPKKDIQNIHDNVKLILLPSPLHTYSGIYLMTYYTCGILHRHFNIQSLNNVSTAGSRSFAVTNFPNNDLSVLTACRCGNCGFNDSDLNECFYAVCM